MRLIPAHLREAKDMAKDLKNSLDDLGLAANCHDQEQTPATLQQVQEMLAKCLGFPGGWLELRTEVARPHSPIYIDRLPLIDADRASEEMTCRLAMELGYDYGHGSVANALANAGIGCSPATRRQFAASATPWGIPIDDPIEVASGITSVQTGSHGGLCLNAMRQNNMPEHLMLEEPFYEEHIDWALVALAFPLELNEHIGEALCRVEVIRAGTLPKVRDPNDAGEAFLAKHSLSYVDPAIDPLNRPLTDLEREVIRFLAHCVLQNRKPSISPDTDYPTLEDWLTTLSGVPRLNGQWPKQSHPWRRHWGQWERDADDRAAMQDQYGRLI